MPMEVFACPHRMLERRITGDEACNDPRNFHEETMDCRLLRTCDDIPQVLKSYYGIPNDFP